MTTRVSNLTRERRELKRCEEVFQSAAAGESMPAKFCGTINATTESVIVRARAGTRVLLPPYRTPESLQRPISGLSWWLCRGLHYRWLRRRLRCWHGPHKSKSASETKRESVSNKQSWLSAVVMAIRRSIYSPSAGQRAAGSCNAARDRLEAHDLPICQSPQLQIILLFTSGRASREILFTPLLSLQLS